MKNPLGSRFAHAVVATVLLAFFQNSAEATRARNMVMGSGDPTDLILHGAGNDGSYYYDSPYNIFFNPAWVNRYDHMVFLEKSNYPGISSAGGIIESFGPFHTALFLNRYPFTAFYLDAAVNAGLRPVDLTFGSSTDDVGWGVGLNYVRYRNTQLNEDKADDIGEDRLLVRVGLQIGNIEPFARLAGPILSSERLGSDKTNQTKVAHSEYVVGTRYKDGDWRLLAAGGLLRGNVKTVQTGGANPGGYKIGVFGFSVAKMITTKIGKFYANTGYWRLTEAKSNIVPLDFSLESEIASWIAFRAGLKFRLIHTLQGSSIDDSTEGLLGFTVKYNRYALDWILGSSAKKIAPVIAFEDGSEGTTQSFGIDSGFFTAAAVRAEW